MTTKPAAPTIEGRTSDSLSLVIELPPAYNGDYRIQWYEAGFVYNGGWQTKIIAPHSAVDCIPKTSGWLNGLPVFKNEAVFRLGGLEANKVNRRESYFFLWPALTSLAAVLRL